MGPQLVALRHGTQANPMGVRVTGHDNLTSCNLTAEGHSQHQPAWEEGGVLELHDICIPLHYMGPQLVAVSHGTQANPMGVRVTTTLQANLTAAGGR
jgi:hypothetical protein